MDLISLFKTRRSYRKFDEGRKVPEEVIDSMKEAIRLSSSAGNTQELKYVFVCDKEKADKVFEHLRFAAYLPEEQGKPKVGERPVMYVLVMKDKNKNLKWINTDAGIATANMTLAAWEQGVGSCIIANMDREDIAGILGIDSGMEILFSIAFGYPLHRSEVVPLKEDGSIKYYVDEEMNYYVPKKAAEDIISII